MHAEADKQGLVQGIITGMRGLCNGLGPAMFGLVFSLFHVDLSEKSADNNSSFENNDGTNNTVMQEVPQSFLMVAQIVPAGPPFCIWGFACDTSPYGSGFHTRKHG